MVDINRLSRLVYHPLPHAAHLLLAATTRPLVANSTVLSRTIDSPPAVMIADTRTMVVGTHTRPEMLRMISVVISAQSGVILIYSVTINATSNVKTVAGSAIRLASAEISRKLAM